MLQSLRIIEISIIVLLINLLFTLGVNIASHMRNDDLTCIFRSSVSNSHVFTPLQMAALLLVRQGLSSVHQILLCFSSSVPRLLTL